MRERKKRERERERERDRERERLRERERGGGRPNMKAKTPQLEDNFVITKNPKGTRMCL